ncbi:hypothetical protein MPER_02060 [Moniliophthora perniciosa FA553]|nr:hypothetical protein MPER_02060 [Moniliophthora perniciosa FA553]
MATFPGPIRTAAHVPTHEPDDLVIINKPGSWQSHECNLVQSVSRIIFESGLLYPMLSTVGLILNNIPILEMVPFDPYPTITLSAGIAPTLILVRAKFGKNIESLQPQLSDICFTGRQPTRKSSDTAAQVGSLGNLSTGRVDGERWDEQRIADGKEIP